MAEKPEGKQTPGRSLKAKARTHTLSLLILLAKANLMTNVRGQERYPLPTPSMGGTSPIVQRGTEDRPQ